MTYLANRFTLADGVQLDAFSRLRVSNATTIFDSQQEYGLQTRITWDACANGTFATPSTNGSASSASNAVGPTNLTTKMTPITVSTTSGHYAVLQSRQYTRYIPGKSHLVLVTGIFSPGTVANTDARVGYFDAYNGIFLKVTNGAASFVRRTYTSGATVDNAVAQAAWNIDRFDGNGPSGITVDLTKTQILFIQAQWLGVGRVIVGFDIAGILYPAHQFLNANVLAVPYTQTFNLPVRLELRNTGTSVGATIQFVCCSVQSEGGEEARGFPRSANNGITPVGATTRRAVLSVRPAATFNSLTNRAHLALEGYFIRCTTNDLLYEIVVGGTLTGASWTAVTNSCAEFDVAATTVTGGSTVDSGYVTTTGSGGSAKRLSSGSIDFRNPLVISQVDAALNRQDPVSIVVTPLTGTTNVLSSLSWHEQVI